MADFQALFAIAVSAVLGTLALTADLWSPHARQYVPAAHWLAAEVAHQPKPVPDAVEKVPGTSPLVVKRSPEGFYFVTASLNGVPTRFMIDTGANTMVIKQADADKAGLVPRGTVRMQTVGGEIRAPKTRIPMMTLGTSEALHVEAVIVGNHLETSLIGTKALAQFGPVILDGPKLALTGRNDMPRASHAQR